MWYKSIAGRFFGLVTKHACDRRTDGQNYDSQDRASIAASRVVTIKVGHEIIIRNSSMYVKIKRRFSFFNCVCFCVAFVLFVLSLRDE